jgi:hypothetical protein
MFKRLLIAVVTAPAIALLGLAGAAAHASVSPTTIYNSNGEAGIYSFTAYPFFQDVSDTIPLTVAMEGNSDTTSGDQTFGVGNELCEESTGQAVQEGVVYNGNGTFDLLAEDGTLTQDTPNTASYLNDNCVSGGALSTGGGFDAADPLSSYPDATIVLSEIPVGDSVSMTMTQVGDKVYAWGEDITQAIGDNTVTIDTDGTPQFDIAGAGTVQNTADLSYTDPLFALTTLSDVNFSSGHITAGPSYFSAVNVVSNASGNSSDPVLVAGAFTAGTGRVCTTTGEKGHWSEWYWVGKKHHEHRVRYWRKSTLKTTCTAGTQASLALSEGSQVGA